MGIAYRFRKFTRIALVLSILATALIAMSAPVSAVAGEDCNDPTGENSGVNFLSGSVANNGKTATITNFSDTCTVQVGLASYKIFELNSNGTPDLTSQKLFDHKTTMLGPGESVTLKVSLPDCMAQVDAFHGDVIVSFANEGPYGDRLLNARIVGSGLCEETPPPSTKAGRMTGGGSLFHENGMRVTHGFQIRCDADDKRQNLQINWTKGKFHLLDMTSAVCTDDPNIVPDPPKGTPFDTYTGVGTGRYNGVDGATVRFVFTDAGEPGVDDKGQIEVTDKNGNVVLFVEITNVDRGNHQAHKK